MKLLFIPVSAPRGFGEYARARQIALAAAARWPRAEIRFVLSREAPYAQQCPFPATLLPASATLHSPDVIALIRSFRPDLVVFDNAGRAAQIRAARMAGAKVVYISSRYRQRARGFRLALLRSIDEHWIAYPEFVAGRLGLIERQKLRLAGGPRVRFLDTLLPAPDPAADARALARFGATPGGYVLVVPGGGTAHPGADDAPAVVARAARELVQRGHDTVLVGVTPPRVLGQQYPPIAGAGVAAAQAQGAGAADPAHAARLITTPLLPMADLAALLRGTRLALTNGGDTLLQALACGVPVLACPIARDQARRIAECERLGLIAAAPLDAGALTAAAATLLADPQRRQAQQAARAARAVKNALPEVLDAIAALLGDPAGAAATPPPADPAASPIDPARPAAPSPPAPGRGGRTDP